MTMHTVWQSQGAGAPMGGTAPQTRLAPHGCRSPVVQTIEANSPTQDVASWACQCSTVHPCTGGPGKHECARCPIRHWRCGCSIKKHLMWTDQPMPAAGPGRRSGPEALASPCIHSHVRKQQYLRSWGQWQRWLRRWVPVRSRVNGLNGYFRNGNSSPGPLAPHATTRCTTCFTFTSRTPIVCYRVWDVCRTVVWPLA